MFNEYLTNADKYDKKHSNKYKSSNAEHFFKSLHKVINNSKDFYNSELENHEIRYLFELNEKLSKILKCINDESKNINPYDFSSYKNQNRLNELKNICYNQSNNIKQQIGYMKNEIKNNISNMRYHKKDTRDDFTKAARRYANDNSDIYETYKTKINDKTTDFINSLKQFIQNIKNLVKENRGYTNSNILNLTHNNSSLTTYIREEENFGIEHAGTREFLISSFIPFYNIGYIASTVIIGIWDHFRDHSEEFESIICQYESSVYESISDVPYTAG